MLTGMNLWFFLFNCLSCDIYFTINIYSRKYRYLATLFYDSCRILKNCSLLKWMHVRNIFFLWGCFRKKVINIFWWISTSVLLNQKSFVFLLAANWWCKEHIIPSYFVFNLCSRCSETKENNMQMGLIPWKTWNTFLEAVHWCILRQDRYGVKT